MPFARLSRCIRLLNLVQSRVGYSAVELAREFEVCKRTVYRDLHTLEEAGIPLRFDHRRAGYVVAACFRSRALPLADDEVVALLLAAHTSSLVSGCHFANLVRQASAKLLAETAVPLREEASRVVKSLIVQPPAGLWSSGAEAVCRELIQAIRQNRRVRISYAPPTDPARLTLTTVVPCRLAVSDTGWQLLGQCSRDKAMHGFDLKHIRGVETVSDHQSVRELEETPAMPPLAHAKRRC